MHRMMQAVLILMLGGCCGTTAAMKKTIEGPDQIIPCFDGGINIMRLLQYVWIRNQYICTSRGTIDQWLLKNIRV